MANGKVFDNELTKEKRRFALTVWALSIVTVIVIGAGVALINGNPETQGWARTLLTTAFGVAAGFALKGPSSK